jgi:hypothetical protein
MHFHTLLSNSVRFGFNIMSSNEGSMAAQSFLLLCACLSLWPMHVDS